jgi:WD40 repeat protein
MTWTGTVRLAFSHDGSILAETFGASTRPRVWLWDVRTGTLRSALVFPEAITSFVTSIAFSPDGRLLAAYRERHFSADPDSAIPATVLVWDVATGREVGAPELAPPKQSDVEVRFSCDGRVLTLSRPDVDILFWNTTTWERLDSPIADANPEVSNLELSEDRRRILQQEESTGDIVLRDRMTGEVAARLRSGGDFIACSRDFSTVASGYLSWGTFPLSQTLQLWDVGTGQVRDLTVPWIKNATFSPDGKTLALFNGSNPMTGFTDPWGGEYGLAQLRDVPSGRLLLEINERIDAFAFSPDGRTLATSGSYSSPVWLAKLPFNVQFWLRRKLGIGWKQIIDVTCRDARTGRGRATLVGPRSVVQEIAFSPDGRIAAAADWDGVITLWDLPR